MTGQAYYCSVSDGRQEAIMQSVTSGGISAILQRFSTVNLKITVGCVLRLRLLVSNHLAVNLLPLPDNRRLRRFLPTDLPDRF
jgi:hypothetical protein